jgi:hypothetical protein
MIDQRCDEFFNKFYMIEQRKFGPKLSAKLFGVEQTMVLNFPIFSKDKADEFPFLVYV